MAWKSSSPLWEQIEQYGDTLPERQQTDAPIGTDNERFQHSPGEKVSKQLFKTSGATEIVKSEPSADKKTAENQTTDTSSTTATTTQQPPAIEPKNGETPNIKQTKRVSSLFLFFRKFYKLAYLRIYELCKNLNYFDESYLQKIWTIFEYCITKQFHLMRDRHLDQILMCSIYVFGRNNKFDTTFRDIMTSYRKQPQSTSAVYRDVHMTENGECNQIDFFFLN